MNRKLEKAPQLTAMAAVTAVALGFTTNSKASPPEPEFAWRETAASLALLNGDTVVWQFNHLAGGEEKGCPYFHPLATLDGALLTDLRPDDHLWHRGLRFAWKKINGVDHYWSWPEGRERWPDKEMGQTDVVSVKAVPGADYSARFELELSYHPPGKPPALTEKRVIAVSAPDENGIYRIDWRGVFTAGKEGAVLDRTPIPGEEGGKAWGGYAGLQLRVARRDRLTGWRLLNSEGTGIANPIAQKEGLDRAHGKQARWMDLTLELADGRTAGAALFDHPGNLRHPAVWHVSSMPNELIQTPIFHGPHTIEAGKSQTFRYLVIVHPDRVSRGFLEQQWQEFAGSQADQR